MKHFIRFGAMASALLPVISTAAKNQKGTSSVETPQLQLRLGARASENRQQPNVIIIFADDLGYGDLECFGASRVQTPNVNALAQSGIRFTNVHASAATSTPSRKLTKLSGFFFEKRCKFAIYT